MKHKLPSYILAQLKAHGNTIISTKSVRKIGSIEKVLAAIEEEGFTCKIEKSQEKVMFDKMYDHYVIKRIDA